MHTFTPLPSAWPGLGNAHKSPDRQSAVTLWGVEWVCSFDEDGFIDQVQHDGRWLDARATLRDTLCNALQVAHARALEEDTHRYVEDLEAHDWDHERSDDHRSYCLGKHQRASLKERQPKLDPDFKIWNSLCKSGHENGGRL